MEVKPDIRSCIPFHKAGNPDAAPGEVPQSRKVALAGHSSGCRVPDAGGGASRTQAAQVSGLGGRLSAPVTQAPAWPCRAQPCGR